MCPCCLLCSGLNCPLSFSNCFLCSLIVSVLPSVCAYSCVLSFFLPFFLPLWVAQPFCLISNSFFYSPVVIPDGKPLSIVFDLWHAVLNCPVLILFIAQTCHVVLPFCCLIAMNCFMMLWQDFCRTDSFDSWPIRKTAIMLCYDETEN